jgi:hypothetical protein
MRRVGYYFTYRFGLLLTLLLVLGAVFARQRRLFVGINHFCSPRSVLPQRCILALVILGVEANLAVEWP